MKKTIVATDIIAVCGALCASVWPLGEVGGKVLTETAVSAILTEEAEAPVCLSPYPMRRKTRSLNGRKRKSVRG